MSATECPAGEYTYTPLPSATCIRLVDLQPSTARQGETLEISLLTVDLDNAPPPFNALSYTWGDPRCPYLDDGPAAATTPTASYLVPSHVILCDGRRFMARRNLIDALRRLVAAGAGGSDALSRSTQGFVWIDAICIDQGNLNERTMQVRMMMRIFESAEYIVGWLGPADSTTAAALSVVSRLAAAAVPAPAGSGHHVPRSADDVRALQRRFAHVTEADFFEQESFEAKLGVRHITGPEWLAWLALLYRPYFRRAWIIQEVVVARRIVMACGDTALSWSDFAASVFLVWAVGSWWALLSQEILATWFLPPATSPAVAAGGSAEWDKFRRLAEGHGVDISPVGPVALVKLRAYSRSDRPEGACTPASFALRALLIDHRGAQATDPRDKLFALLGLADRTKHPFSEPAVAAGALAPDYQCTVAAVYIRLTRCMIRCYGDLRLLQQRELGRLRKLTSLPSWVTDYTVWQVPAPLDESGRGWKASGDEKWDPDDRGLEDPLLTVRGRCIGRVEEVALSSLECSGATGTGRAWGSMFGLVSRLSHDGERLQRLTTLELLARTVTCDKLQMQSPAPSETLRDQFLAFAAERCAVAMRSFGKYSEVPGRSLRDRLVGRFHHFNIAHFDRSPGDHRYTPIISAFRAEPAGSPYGMSFLRERVQEYMNQTLEKALAAGEATRPKFYGYFSGANPLNGEFRRQSESCLSCRTIFRTDGGQLLGLGPADMRADDEVWVFSGSNTPQVLRRSPPSVLQAGQQQPPPRHSLVGQAFVHSMMHGESLVHFPDVQEVILE